MTGSTAVLLSAVRPTPVRDHHCHYGDPGEGHGDGFGESRLALCPARSTPGTSYCAHWPGLLPHLHWYLQEGPEPVAISTLVGVSGPCPADAQSPGVRRSVPGRTQPLEGEEVVVESPGDGGVVAGVGRGLGRPVTQESTKNCLTCVLHSTDLLPVLLSAGMSLTSPR